MEKRVTFPLRLDAELHEALSEAAFELKISKQQFVQESIKERISRVDSGEELLK